MLRQREDRNLKYNHAEFAAIFRAEDDDLIQ